MLILFFVNLTVNPRQIKKYYAIIKVPERCENP